MHITYLNIIENVILFSYFFIFTFFKIFFYFIIFIHEYINLNQVILLIVLEKIKHFFHGVFMMCTTKSMYLSDNILSFPSSTNISLSN